MYPSISGCTSPPSGCTLLPYNRILMSISHLSGPRIHYIRSPRTLHSLYPLSPDPAFTISALPGPCIHYIRSPRTPHESQTSCCCSLHQQYIAVL
ncbi:unnamed protein product [Staurois parvus]|uniref:Uncharacterized protein n=1 Tax=Staurois parvus TaxID=386267 RepID=A0ABN9D6Y9_9NEOB|nr:unnamed protein product [Staurois parvus]